MKYLGKACIRGHSGIRYASTNECVQCAMERSKSRSRAKAARVYRPIDPVTAAVRGWR